MIRSSLTLRQLQVGLALALSSVVACAPNGGAKSPDRCGPEPAPAKPEAAKEPVAAAATPTKNEEGGSGFGSSGPDYLGGGGIRRNAHVRVGKLTTEGVYDAKVAARILRQNYARFLGCYEKDRFEEPVNLTFTVNAKGEVEKPKGEAKGAKPELLACLEKASLEVAYPAPAKGTVTVKAPLLLIGEFGTKATEPVARFTDELPSPWDAAYDAKNDRYLVSVIDEEKGSGTIVAVDPEGKKASTRFIADGTTSKSGVKITLQFPRSILVVGDLLYVADGTVVRAFALATGEPKGRYEVDPDHGINRLVALADGKLLAGVLDGRLSNEEQDEFLYVVDKNGKSSLFAKGKFGGVSGGAIVDRKLWLANSRGELFTLNEKNESVWVMKPTAGSLSSVVAIPGGVLFLDSNEDGTGNASFGSIEGPYRHVVDGVPAASGVAWDTKRKRLVVVSSGTPGIVVYSITTSPAK